MSKKSGRTARYRAKLKAKWRKKRIRVSVGLGRKTGRRHSRLH